MAGEPDCFLREFSPKQKEKRVNDTLCLAWSSRRGTIKSPNDGSSGRYIMLYIV